MLKPIFKPKWKHSDPEQRLRAVQTHPEIEAPVLAELARSDEDGAVREAAVNRLTDLDVLNQLARNDADARARDAAASRLGLLLAGGHEASPTLETRSAYLERLAGLEHVLRYIVRHAQEPELRRSAMDRLADDLSALVAVAKDDAARELRLHAIDRIEDIDALEEIARVNRNRDKGVYRHAQDRLSGLVEVAERPERVRKECAAIVQALTGLGEHGISAATTATFQDLERRWEAVSEEAPEDLRQQYDTLTGAYRALVEAEEAKRRVRAEAEARQRGLCEQLERELARLKTLAVVDEDERAKALALVGEVRQAFDAEDSDSADANLRARFDEAAAALEAHLDRERAERAGLVQLDELAAEVARLTAVESPPAGKALRQLEERWSGIKAAVGRLSGEAAQTGETLQAQLDALRARHAEDLKQKKARLAEIDQQFDRLEAALGEGTVTDAQTIRQGLTELLDEPGLVTGEQRRQIERRIKPLDAKLRELRDWQQWGSRKAREELCEEVEGLVGAELHPEELQKRIRAAQTAWKKLDKADPVSGRQLWPRFNAACNSAYEPCRAYFKERAEERQANLQARQTLCQEIEDTLAGIDWDSVDWHALDRFARRVRQDWRNLGPTDRKFRKEIETRYQNSMRVLNEHLDAERERNLELKRTLIAEAEALKEHENLNEAINRAKDLQRRWKTTVAAKRSEEQRLWETFRGHCDAVFERRRAAQDAQDKVRREQLEARETLCAELEQLAAELQPDAVKAARARLREVQQAYGETGPVPRDAQPQIDKRFDQAIKALKARFDGVARERAQAEQTLLRDKAALCREVEDRLSSDVSSDGDASTREASVAESRQRWEALDELRDGPTEARLAKRFDRACKRLAAELPAPGADELEGNRRHLEELAIRMEILAEIESPPEAQEARMAYQVQRLSQAMGGRQTATGPEEKRREMVELEIDWLTTGPVAPDDRRVALDQRLISATSAFWKG